MKIYGRNSVREAIVSGNTIDRLIVERGMKDAGANKIINEAKSRGIKIDFRDREALDREVKERHQGFVAEITDFKYATLEEVIDGAKPNPLFIIADGIEDPHNLGSILRVAECAGADAVIIPDRRSVSVNETVIRVSAGAASHVRVAKVTNINSAIDTLKKNNVWVYAAELGGEPLYSANLTGSIAIVVGGEGKGVHALTRKKCDGIVSIPVHGMVNSLNASVACGVVVFEVLRQRNEQRA